MTLFCPPLIKMSLKSVENSGTQSRFCRKQWHTVPDKKCRKQWHTVPKVVFLIKKCRKPWHGVPDETKKSATSSYTL